MSYRPQFKNKSGNMVDLPLDAATVRGHEVYSQEETDKLLNGKYDVKEFTVEKGHLGEDIRVYEFFDYLIEIGFNPSEYMGKICRFSYVDLMDIKYQYLVIPTYFDNSNSYTDFTIISDNGVYKAYIQGDGHGIEQGIYDDWFYSYCGQLYELQTKAKGNLVNAINEVNAKAKANADSLSDLKTALYGYVLDTASVNIFKDNVPSTVDVAGVTYDLVDNVRASFNRLGGKSYFDSDNLLTLPDVEETTKSGVTYSIKNGVVRINGTATGNGIVKGISLNYTGTYYFQPFMSGTITPNSSGETKGIQIFADSEGSAPGYNQAGVCVNPTSFRIWFAGGATYNNVMFKPMLVRGSTPPAIKVDYPSSIHITKRNFTSKEMLKDELASLDGFLDKYDQYGAYLMGYSINDNVYNYIDFAKKKFIINCGERSYQAGDEADPNVFTDLTKSIYKLETPIEVNISSIIKDDSGITPPVELGGRIIGFYNNVGVKCNMNIEMVYRKIKESAVNE